MTLKTIIGNITEVSLHVSIIPRSSTWWQEEHRVSLHGVIVMNAQTFYSQDVGFNLFESFFVEQTLIIMGSIVSIGDNNYLL